MGNIQSGTKYIVNKMVVIDKKVGVRIQLPVRGREYFGGSLFLIPMPTGRLLFSRKEDLESFKESFVDIHPGREAALRFAFADVIEISINEEGYIVIPTKSWRHIDAKGKLLAEWRPFGIEMWVETGE